MNGDEVMQKNTKEDFDVTKAYADECLLPKDEFIKKYHVKTDGLSSQEASSKISKYGLNEISQNKPKKWYNYFFESLFSPFNCILLLLIPSYHANGMDAADVLPYFLTLSKHLSIGIFNSLQTASNSL